jgi:uncharacterized iron-regulated membrane protein
VSTQVSGKERRASARRVALLAHRYVGLLTAAFLFLAGVTGSLIAFYVQIDAALNPELFRARPSRAGAAMLDPFELRDRLQQQLPKDQPVNGVLLHLQPGESVNYWIDGRETFVDPYTGKILGTRTWGDLSEGLANLMPFLYRLHFSLALDDVGMFIFGIIALLWTLDCFVGAYLTFPLPSQRAGGSTPAAWLRRWLPAWLIKTNKLFALVFTWHRASGLWVWFMFLIFAWSAVALNLGEQVYDPIMRTFFGEDEQARAWDHLPELDPPRRAPKIALRAAHAVARRLIAEQAGERGFDILGERSLDYQPEHGVYVYTIESTLDISERLAETSLAFDGDDGRVRAFSAPTGAHTGSTISSWLVALHFGAVRVGGLAYRSFVCVMGIVVALLSVTGVWIWWKKRKPRARPSAPAAGDE